MKHNKQKNEYLSIRVSEAEKSVIKDAANASALSISDFVVSAALNMSHISLIDKLIPIRLAGDSVNSVSKGALANLLERQSELINQPKLGLN